MIGEYNIDIAAQGYNDITTTLLIERDAQTARASLTLEKTVYNVKLEILGNSNKPLTGANVTIYDTQKGEMTFVTDANGCAYLDLTMNDYPILVTYEGYQPASIDLEVGAYDTNSLTKLQLASQPPMMPLSSIIALTAIAILIPVILAAYMKRHLKPAINSDHTTIKTQ
jgi:uncharacterized membrane protein